jgi:hypothetical protein
VDPGVVARLRDDSKAEGVEPTEFSAFAGLVAAIVTILLAGGMMAVVYSAHLSFEGLGGILQTAFFVGFGAVVLLALFFSVPYSIVGLRRQWTSFARAHAFADANEMVYVAREDGHELEGAVFHMPGTQTPRAGSVFRSIRVPGFEVAGHYHYTRDKSEVHWGYIAVDFGRPLPHLVLHDTRRARTHRTFLSGYASSPLVALSGPTASRFILHGRPDDASEAAALFPESLLGALPKLGRGIDAETLGTHLFVYSSRPFAVPRPKAVRQVFEVVDLILDVRG